MAFSSPLLVKGLAGLGVVTTVTVGGIYAHKQGFFNFETSSYDPTNSEFLLTKWDKKLLEKVKSGSGLQFSSNPENFDSPFNNQNKEISITFSANTSEVNDINGGSTWTWECKIKFTKTNGTTIVNEDKNLFNGFLQKIKSEGMKHKPIKERFIKKCAEERRDRNLSLNKTTSLSSPIQSEKEFVLTSSDSTNLRVGENQKEEFKNWFGEVKLTNEEKDEIKNNNNWVPTLDETAKTLTLSNINSIDSCSVTLTIDNISDIKSKLEAKIGTGANINENNKKYRRGFLKKCRNQGESITMSADFDLSILFDLSDEELTVEEEKLKIGTWTISQPAENGNHTLATITVNAQGSESSSMSCKIIGFLSGDGSIAADKLTTSKPEIQKTLEGKLGESANNKEINRKVFLSKCKKSFNEEIKWELQETSDKSKYELKELDKLFS